MLPRWLTALPRFARTYRDELLVVAIGLVYQAGASGALVAHRPVHTERVVVRIAAPPVKVVTHVDAAVAVTHAHDHAAHAGATRAARAAQVAAARADVAARRAATAMAAMPMPAMPVPAMPAPAAAAAAPAAPVVAVPAIPRVVTVGPVAGASIVAVRADGRRFRVVSPEAGENMAAAIEDGLVVGDSVLRELRDLPRNLDQARAALEEARVRAALQKALSAEQAAAMVRQAPGIRRL